MGAQARGLWSRLTLAVLLAVAGALLPAGAWPQSAPARAGATVLLEARHLGSLVRFYESELELPVLARDASTGRTVFDAGGTQLVVIPRRPMDEPQNVTARLLLPCAALDSARVRLQNLKVPYRSMTLADGTPWALFFQDPEGNSLGYCVRVTSSRCLAHEPARHRGGRTPRPIGPGGVSWSTRASTGCGSPSRSPSGWEWTTPRAWGSACCSRAPLMVCAAHQYGKRTQISRGQAGTISIVGNWATWQGLGWAIQAEADGEDVVLAGALSGTAAIVATAALVRGRDISPGQATVLHAATYWGAWYGIVGAGMAEASKTGSSTPRLPRVPPGFSRRRRVGDGTRHQRQPGASHQPERAPGHAGRLGESAPGAARRGARAVGNPRRDWTRRPRCGLLGTPATGTNAWGVPPAGSSIHPRSPRPAAASASAAASSTLASDRNPPRTPHPGAGVWVPGEFAGGQKARAQVQAVKPARAV